jgi:hypothetical protein
VLDWAGEAATAPAEDSPSLNGIRRWLLAGVQRCRFARTDAVRGVRLVQLATGARPHLAVHRFGVHDIGGCLVFFAAGSKATEVTRRTRHGTMNLC